MFRSNLLKKLLPARVLSMPAAILLAMVLQVTAVIAAVDYTAWYDLGIIYTAPAGDAYYPSVLYDEDGFAGGSPFYKMWYTDGSGGVFLVPSLNGLTWGSPVAANVGLGNDAHHVQVVYDASCFGVLPCDSSTPKYKIWYWDTDANLYSISAMATAQSVDGLTWTNDTTLTQSGTSPLVTGAGTGWNRGTYGPVFIFYQAAASNFGSNPWDYSYVLYYDGTDGSSEVTGLGYSTDGMFWTAYSSSPVLDKGSGKAWDCDDAAYGTVYHNADGFHFWYSGGGGDNGLGACSAGDPVQEGIGYASSADGLTWTKDPSNPILHIDDGISYRNRRVYTPAVVDDGSGILKMYYSAQQTGSGQPKTIGLALNAVTLDLSISKLTATDARLSWTATPGASTYELYRDSAPYFNPANPPYQSLPGLSFDDLGALGDVNTNHYYVVKATYANGSQSERSNRVGEYDYPLVSTAPLNYNDIAMVLQVPGVTDAASLATYIGSNVKRVMAYDAANQVFQLYLVGNLATNFDLSIGQFVYLVTDNTAPATTSLVGGVLDEGSITFSLLSDSSLKYNFISLPLDRADLTSASEVADDVGSGVYWVMRYLIESQTFETYIPGNPATDFSLEIGEPFILVLITGAPTNWP